MRKAEAGTAAAEESLSVGEQWRLYWRFMRYLRPYRGKFGLIIFLLFVGTPLTQISLFLTRNLTDEVVLAGNLPTDARLRMLWVYLGAQAALFFTGYLLELVRETMVWYLEWKVGFDLRTVFYRHLHRLSLDFFRSRSIGEQMFRATGDILWGGGIVYLITRGLPSILNILYSLLWALALIAVIDPMLSVAVVVYIVPFALVKEWLVRRQRPLAFRVREGAETEASALRDSIAGLRTVESMGRMAWAALRFVRAAVLRQRIEWHAWSLGFVAEKGVLWLLSFIFDRWLWLYIAWRVVQGELTIGDWLVVFVMVGSLRSPLQHLIVALLNIRLQLVSGQRILETLDTTPTVADPPHALRLPSLRGELALENVSFGYSPGRPALSGIDLHLPAGTRAAFVGPSGAGKSTLLALLLRLYDPMAGVVRVDGHDLRVLAREAYLEQIAVVPQETFLFSGTIAENLLYARPDATDDDLRRAADEAGALAFIDALPDGFDTHLGAGTRLSGGQKQRLGIARALLRRPRILILDEPTANLDARTEKAILDTLEQVGKGRTVITIAHRLPTITGSDTIVVLDGGRIVSSGTHEELLSRPGLYRDLWRAQTARPLPLPGTAVGVPELADEPEPGSDDSRYARQPVPPPPQGGRGRGLRNLRSEWHVFRRTLSFLHPYRSKIGLLALLGVAAATLDGIAPLLSKPLLDHAFPQRDWGMALRIFGVLAGFEVVRHLFSVISGAQSFYVGQRLRLDLRARFYRHLQRLSLTYVESRSVGEQMYRGTTDVDAVAEMVAGILPAIVSLVYTFALTLVFTTFLDPMVALFVLAYLVPYAVLHTRFTNIQRSLDRDERWWGESATGRLQEGIAGVLTVRMLGRRHREVAEYTGRNVTALRIGVSRYAWLTLQHFTIGVVMPFTKDKAVWAYFARKVILGEATIGMFVPLIAFADRLTSPIQQLIEFINWVRQTLIPAERLMETLDAAPEVAEASHAGPMPPLQGEIRFDNVYFAYEPDRPAAARGLDFALPPGRRVAIVGLSGAGKSTLLALLLRLHDPDAGRVLVDGLDLRDVRRESYRRQIGVVLQETYLFSGTVADNLRLTAPEADAAQMQRAARIAGIHDWISTLPQGYDTDLNEGTSLSPGQKQRLGIARAVISDPRLLLLDEPTSSLDPRTEAEILDALWAAASGRTTLLVTHRLNTVTRADEVWVMADGRIARRGPHDRLLAEDKRYRDLWRMQDDTKQEAFPA